MELNAPPMSIDLKACQGSHFKLPEGMVLASGVYSITLPQSFPPKQRLTVEVEHCFRLKHPDQLVSLSFMSSQSSQLYNLQILEGGIFMNGSSYGSISLSRTSLLAVACDGSSTGHEMLTYYVPVNATTWLLHVFITLDLTLYLQVCHSSVPHNCKILVEDEKDNIYVCFSILYYTIWESWKCVSI